MILALNRCVHIIHPGLAKRLFDGPRVYVWLLIPLAIAVAFLFFPPLVYNGVAFAWIVNPHYGYLEDDGTRYSNHLHMVNNLVVSTGLLVLYATFVIVCRKKTGGMKILTTHVDYSV
ncbi:SRT-39 protein [Aphelenchoides avenae]|nr:SRT-39 protein [Aphelenchus avenae]